MGCSSSKNAAVVETKLIKVKTVALSVPTKLPPEVFEGFNKILRPRSDKIMRNSSKRTNYMEETPVQPEEPLTNVDSKKEETSDEKKEEEVKVEPVIEEKLILVEPDLLDMTEMEAIANETNNFHTEENKKINEEKSNEGINEMLEVKEMEAIANEGNQFIVEETKIQPEENPDVIQEGKAAEEISDAIREEKEAEEKRIAEEAERLAYEQRLQDEEDLELQKVLMGSMENEAQAIAEKYT